MSWLRSKLVPVPVERRAAKRSLVDCPARLQTVSGQCVGRLWDLSRTGARFQAEAAPVKGATALLKWGNHESLCKVVWVSGGNCGLEFAKALPQAIVEECTEWSPGVSGPVAELNKIQVGRKRSALTRSEERTGHREDEKDFRCVVYRLNAESPDQRNSGRMTAAEEMFLLGSPLLHVVTYRQWQTGKED
jgi:hypothetical protein